MSEQPPPDGSYWQRPQGWEPPEGAEVARRRRGRAVWVVAAVLVLLAAGLAAWRLWPNQDEEVRRAAQEFVDAVSTGDCERADARSTGQAAGQLDQYCTRESGTTLATLLGGRDPRVEVSAVEGDQATAVVSTSVVGVSVRVDLNMRHEDGEWKVAQVVPPAGLPADLPVPGG